MHIPARILSVFIALLVFLSVLSPIALAQTQNPYAQLMKTDGSVQMSISTLAQGVVVGLLSTATCIVGGIDFATPNHQCLAYDAKTQTYSYAKNSGDGLLGLSERGIALTYNSPFHFSDYTQYLSQNFGLVKSAHAASSAGFAQLSPIANLWIAFRNLSYLIFVILFIVVGFAVMLRAKIDPRTVMTIENQIPKLIVALILITFSFAIAGLVIDIMWVGVYLVINIFGNLDPALKGQIGSLTASAWDIPFNWVSSLNKGPFGFIGIAMQAAGGVKDASNQIAFDIFQNAPWLKIFTLFSLPGLILMLTCSIAGIIHVIPFAPGGQDFGSCLDGGMSTLVSTVIGGVAFLIFAVALLVAIAKLWWQLIKAYVLFLIFAIFGPLIIMSGVIPGWTKTNFEYWLRHILAYTIVFPTAMGVFLLGKTLMDVYSSNVSPTVAPPLFGVSPHVLSFMGPLIGFAVMMLAPQSLAMVQDALNAPDPKYLASIGASIGVGSAVFGGGIGKLWDRGWRESDPLRGLDEGWFKKLLLPRGSRRREIFIGKETGTGLKPNP